MSDTLDSPEVLRGHLVIFVEGYKMVQKHLMHVFAQDGEHICVPDRFVPPPKYEVGSEQWWREGWAVGDNDRGRLCMRTGAKPLKQFLNYDEAVDYAYRRRQRKKAEQHYLVYVLKDWRGHERMSVVRSMDDVEAFEAALDEEKRIQDEGMALRKAEFAEEHPHYETLKQHFGLSRSYVLSDLLLKIRKEGLAAAKAATPKATFYRALRDIKSCGIDPEKV